MHEVCLSAKDFDEAKWAWAYCARLRLMFRGRQQAKGLQSQQLAASLDNTGLKAREIFLSMRRPLVAERGQQELSKHF
eukprot:1158634-Pelagomonas_calceolata.AAC.3